MFVNTDRTLIIGVYVDDIVIASKEISKIKALKGMLASVYPIKDKGELQYVLGVQIIRDRKNKSVFIAQSYYTYNILKAYKLDNSTLVVIPIETNYDSIAPARADEPRADLQLYQQANGSILHLYGISRPDITYAINK
jgi:hypothetical protein